MGAVTGDFVSIALVVAGVVHLLPLAGVAGSSRLASLYGVSATEPNLAILLRHRAVLFGLLGAFLLYSAFRAELEGIALIAASISLATFVALSLVVGGLNQQIRRVVVVDLFALALVIAAGVVHVLAPTGATP